MARQASSKPADSNGTDVFSFGIRHSGFVISTVWVQHFIHHLAPQTALRDSAFLQREALPQGVLRSRKANEAKNNMAGVDFVCLRYAPAVLANGSMSSNQSGDCPARPPFAKRNLSAWEPIGGAVASATAFSKPKAKPQSLPRQRDIRRALIEADLVDTALRDSAFPKREAKPQVLSEAKNNMVALPGQLFYSTQIPVCLWFLAKSKAADAKRGFRDRRKQSLFIDARKLSSPKSKRHFMASCTHFCYN